MGTRKNKKIRVFEAFAGIGAQATALKRIGIDFEIVGISDWFTDAIIQKKKYEISDECREKLITASDLEAEAIIAKKEQKVTTSLQNELDIFNKQAPFWESMIKRGKEQDVLNPYDVQLLQVAVNYCNLVYTELSPKQVKGIVSIVAKLKENGIE